MLHGNDFLKVCINYGAAFDNYQFSGFDTLINRKCCKIESGKGDHKFYKKSLIVKDGEWKLKAT